MKSKVKTFIISTGIIIFIFLFKTNSTGQPFWEWEAKTPLTDSVSDNINPHLLISYDASEAMMIMVWEKSTDANSSAIYYTNLLNPEEPRVVASEPGVHFTHPKILKLYDSFDFHFYVFYQSDQDGNQDIYYMKYGFDGQFTGPFPFATGESDQEDFVSENQTYFAKSGQERYVVSSVAWTSDGDLVTSNLEKNGDVFSFSDPVVLDTGNCSSPAIVNDQMIYYIREDDNGSFIYVVYEQSPPGNWGEPVLYFDEGNCFNLAEDNVTPQYLTWSADSNGVYRNYIASSWFTFDGNAIGPGQDTPMDPCICTIVIGVEPEQKEFYDFYMAFPYHESGNAEIFMNEGWGGNPEFYNFSQSYTENRNPEFYLGEIYPWNVDCFYVYLIWEEFRNDHWQIFSSKTVMCVGGINENAENESFIKTYPDPFVDQLNIDYTLSAEKGVQIDVINLYGQKVITLFHGKQSAGQQHILWDGRDNSGNEVPPGFYLVRLTEESGFFSARVIKAD
jgi:hypothetical protein